MNSESVQQVPPIDEDIPISQIPPNYFSGEAKDPSPLTPLNRPPQEIGPPDQPGLEEAIGVSGVLNSIFETIRDYLPVLGGALVVTAEVAATKSNPLYNLLYIIHFISYFAAAWLGQWVLALIGVTINNKRHWAFVTACVLTVITFVLARMAFKNNS
jgi:hypothetical protein